MTRITAFVTVAAASAALATAAVGTGMLPAFAAARPAAHSAARGIERQIARKMPGARIGTMPSADPVRITSQYRSGQYVSVVTCEGAQVPPPVRLRVKGTPIRVSGNQPSAVVARAIARPGRYKTVYTCQVVVEKEVPPAPGKGGGIKPCERYKGTISKCHVTLNTGFGGAAGSVARHRVRH